MKKIEMKLSQLNKDSMTERHQAQLMGGNYCYWGDANQAANDRAGVCSCICVDGYNYYGGMGLDFMAGSLKYF